jgi:hypothetical protein
VEVLRLPVSGDVDEVVVIDVDAVFTRGPEAPVLLAASLVQKAGITRTTQACSRFPALSNSSTDGAGKQQPESCP